MTMVLHVSMLLKYDEGKMHELLHRHFNFFPLYKWNFCCVSTATQYAASVHYIIIAAFVYLFHVFFFRQGFPTELDLKN